MRLAVEVALTAIFVFTVAMAVAALLMHRVRPPNPPP